MTGGGSESIVFGRRLIGSLCDAISRLTGGASPKEEFAGGVERPRESAVTLSYHILGVRDFRAHTISGRGFNLFKPLRHHFRATRVAVSRRDPGDRNASVTTRERPFSRSSRKIATESCAARNLRLRHRDDRLRRADFVIREYAGRRGFRHRDSVDCPGREFFRNFRACVFALRRGAHLGLSFPSAWYQPLTVGVFTKALGFVDLWRNPLAISWLALIYLILSILLLRKQEA